MRPWYVRRVEEFLKARRPGSLARLTAEEISGYLQEVSAQARLADWQFGQLIDSLQLLLVDLAGCPAAKAIDWDWWKAGGRPLEDAHPTVVRSQPPATGLAEGPEFARAAEPVPAPEDPGPGHPGDAVFHPHGAGTARTRGCVDDHNLYPCAQSAGRDAGEEPCGHLVRPAHNTHPPVSEIVVALQYADPKTFSRTLQRWAGLSPRHWRQDGANSRRAAGGRVARVTSRPHGWGLLPRRVLCL